MSALPESIIAVRRSLGERFLRGRGVEIGALHCPLPVSSQVKVSYVDRMTVDGLRRHYPELKDSPLVPVDVVDDGETLSTFHDRQLDFIIAAHVLEHCENPLGTMRNHLAKLRPGGVLLYAIPDKRHSFDRDRPITPFAHLVSDDQAGPDRSRWDHYLEYARLVDKIDDPVQCDARAQRAMKVKYSIHFHVWDGPAFEDFIAKAHAYLGGTFRVEYLAANDTEVIAILRRGRWIDRWNPFARRLRAKQTSAQHPDVPVQLPGSQTAGG